MRKNAIGGFLLLLITWIILVEELSWFSVILGGIVSLACLLFAWKFIPLTQLREIYFFKLVLYVLWLIGEIYMQGFQVIRMIFTDVRIDVVAVKTELRSDFLKTLLVNSVTLTPGSISLNLEGDTVTVLNLGNSREKDPFKTVNDSLLQMERKLLKVQK